MQAAPVRTLIYIKLPRGSHQKDKSIRLITEGYNTYL